MASTLSVDLPVPRVDAGVHGKGLNALRRRIQAAICLRTAETFATMDMTAAKQGLEMEKRLHGTAEIASQASLFIARRGVYRHFTEGCNVRGESTYVIPHLLHNHGDDVVIVPGSPKLSKELLQRTEMNKSGNLLGRTGMGLASKELAGYKKLESQLREAEKVKIVQKVVGGYDYASGKTREDLAMFLLARMCNWVYFYGPSSERAPGDVSTAAADTGDKELDSDEEDEEDDGLDSPRAADRDGLDSPRAADRTGGQPEQAGGQPVNATAEEKLSFLYDELEKPKEKFLPGGWFTFWTRGPLLSIPAEDRLKIGAIESMFDKKSAGRAADRTAQKAAKDKERDVIVLSSGDGKKQARGLAYGVASHKEVALVAQQRQKIDQIDQTNKIAAHSTVLKSKQDRLKSLQEMMKAAASIENEVLIKKYMDQCDELMEDIAKTEEATLSVVQAKSRDDMSASITETFLKRGADSMGVKLNATKKRKKGSRLFSDSDDDE